ncbi:MAG: NAD(P)H-dependent oxidoreductase [Gammaproteobacteria bacterium]|nr:NAD(P)H-dependent oxidoreductase [Gammaproteobacteria bacterium]MDH3447467.1 NAD(P)H-dependent oxidoreductase [Gammaproteobacteria bacterium]
MTRPSRILRLDASANPGASSSRKLGDILIEQLRRREQTLRLRQRDLNQDIALIDSDWVGADFTAADARSLAQRERLAFSDDLIEELVWSDRIIVTTPMYNFGVPAALKAWLDLVCRAGVTFRYGNNGPVGLLEGKSAEVVVTTGGVPLDSPVDFVSGYLRQVFSFIGVEDVTIIGADRMNIDADASFARAKRQIEEIYPAITAREVA